MKVLFPFSKLRANQQQLMDLTLKALNERKHLIVQAPTGIGKTAAVLSPAISFALEHDLTVFFLTPKISQHEIAVQLIQRIEKNFNLNLKAVDLVGRKFMCLDESLIDAEIGFYELCKKKRVEEECNYYRKAVGFNALERKQAKETMQNLEKIFWPIKNHLHLIELCKNNALCPYESAMYLALKSNIIIADFMHLFNPSISEIVLSKTKKDLSKSILIVDEAHNLPNRIREMLSSTLNSFLLNKSLKEAEFLGLKELMNEISFLNKTLKEIANKKLKTMPEALIEKNDLEEKLKFIDLELFAVELKESAIDFMIKARKGNSALLRLSRFFDLWSNDLKENIRIISVKDKKIKIQLKNLDPSIISAKLFNESFSSILMSATMNPMQMYADILGLEKKRTLMKSFPRVFPEENVLHLIVPSVTTKYTERNENEFKKIAFALNELIPLMPGNTIVFFPSFELLKTIKLYLNDFKDFKILMQKEKMNSKEKAELLNEMKKENQKTLLLAVAQGSFAEGIDLPGKELIAAIIVGIPLQEMNLEVKALIDYYQEKFGKGWSYAYIYPAIIKALQAAGRVIRSPEDKGVIVFLDKRYAWKNFKECFPKELNLIKTENPKALIKEFWEKQDSKSLSVY